MPSELSQLSMCCNFNYITLEKKLLLFCVSFSFVSQIVSLTLYVK